MVGLIITSNQFMFSGSTNCLKSTMTPQYENEAIETTNKDIKVGRFISSCNADLIAHREDLYNESSVIKIKPKNGKESTVELITMGTPCMAKYPHTTTLKASEIEVELSPAKIQVVKIRITDKPKVMRNVHSVTKSPAITTLWR